MSRLLQRNGVQTDVAGAASTDALSW
jgi:hypothetical protein